MKRKIFSALAVLLIMSSSLNANATNYKIENSEEDCWDEVEIFLIQAERAGKSMEELAFLSNGAYAVYCYGYTWEDVLSAP